MRRIRALSLVYVVAGTSRVLAAAAASALGLAVAGSFALVVLASTVTAAMAWWLCREHARLPWSAPPGPRMRTLRALYRSNSSMGVLMALTSVDVVLARYVLTGVESGEYALVSTLGRAPVWVTQFLALALVPALARSGSRRAVLRAGRSPSASASSEPRWRLRRRSCGSASSGGTPTGGATGLLLPYLALGTLLVLGPGARHRRDGPGSGTCSPRSPGWP